MAEINWNLAGPGFDPLQTLQVYGAAQKQAIERRQYATDLAAREQAATALQAGDASAAMSALIGAGQYEAARSVAAIGAEQRKARGREAFAGFIRGQGGGAPSPTPAPAVPLSQAAPTAASPSAQPLSADGDIVVTAPQKAPTLADLAEIDPDLAKDAIQFQGAIAKLDEDKRKALEAETEIVASMVPEILKVPMGQRPAFLEQRREFLNQRGIDDDEIAALDLTDTGLTMLQRQAVGVKAALQMEQSDRHHRDSMESQRRSQDITLAGQARTDARAREANMIAAGAVGKEARKVETDLRKEFKDSDIAKSFAKSRVSFQQLRSVLGRKDASAFDDIAGIYSFMRTNDPTSTVREGEFATAQNAAGVPEAIRNLYNKAQSGNRLNARQRQEIVSTAGRLYTQQRHAYNQAADEARTYARDYGVDPDRVARKYISPADRKKPQGTISVPGFPGFSIQRGK